MVVTGDNRGGTEDQCGRGDMEGETRRSGPSKGNRWMGVNVQAGGG